MTTRLDISIGPVQGFVSQSRRTRDLWGSSYLLAFLAAHAMRGAVEAGGRPVVPGEAAMEQDPLYRWVCGHHEDEPPRIGSLPNHFAVEVEGENGSGVARAGIRSLRAAWERVCGAVWSRFVEPACPAGNGTREIWSRRVESFWEVVWTAGDAGADAAGGLLARRKRWRSHHPPEEPGDKCTVMHTLQELSGFVRARDRGRQDAFWDQVRGFGVRDGGGLGPLDLRDNERLCAVAFVKRMFPRVAREALDWEVDASHWPSTVYIGARPWMRRVMSAVPQRAAKYADAVMQGAGKEAFPMRRPPFGSDVSAAGDFPKLDANFLHREFVMDQRRCPLVSETSEASPGVRKELSKDLHKGLRKDLVERLRRLCEARDERGRRLGPPPAFHALLLADGDRLGALASRLGGKSVSKALTAFTRSAPGIVRTHDGVTVYAGGDDVLAMLPVRKALACAEALSGAYRDAFADAGPEDVGLNRAEALSDACRGAFDDAFAGTDGADADAAATLSAAVVFAHVRLPLSQALDEAHRLLDDVAKDGNGRDSLAAAVLKPGGLYCEWATTWHRRGPDGEAGAVGLVKSLAGQLEAGRDSVTPGLSSALIYRIRDLLARLCGWERWRPGSWGDVPGDLDLRAFLRAEIAHSLETRMDDGAAVSAESLTTGVWNLLAPARNPQGGGPAPRKPAAVAHRRPREPKPPGSTEAPPLRRPATAAHRWPREPTVPAATEAPPPRRSAAQAPSSRRPASMGCCSPGFWPTPRRGSPNGDRRSTATGGHMVLPRRNPVHHGRHAAGECREPVSSPSAHGGRSASGGTGLGQGLERPREVAGRYLRGARRWSR